MTSIFVDTHYFVASFQETDQWHTQVVQTESKIVGRFLVTTDGILVEVLNYFSDFGPTTRRKVSQLIHEILSDNDFSVIEQSRPVLLKALELYESRLDKGYSLTDCISMNTCRELGIKQILTTDISNRKGLRFFCNCPLKIRKNSRSSFIPIKIIGRVMRPPKLSLLVFSLKLWNLF